jgi:hypothetical protein
MGRLNRHTLAALSNGFRRTLGRPDRDTNIALELSSGRTRGLLRRVACLSVRVICHIRTTVGVQL